MLITCILQVYRDEARLLGGLGSGNCVTAQTLKNVESFVCHLYAGNSYHNENDVRLHLFLKGAKQPERLPPTQNALIEHIKRAHYQSHIWYTAMTPQPDVLSPIGNGWYESTDGNILPMLMTQDAVPDIVPELTYCKCKSCATRRCSCRQKKLPCTVACECNNGNCKNPSIID